MARAKQKKRKAPLTIAAAPAPAPPGLPPMGGVPQASSDVTGQASGKNTVHTMVDTTADPVDARTARSESRTKRASKAPPPLVAEVAHEKALIAILRVQQQEYGDHMAEMKNVCAFIIGGRDRQRLSTFGAKLLIQHCLKKSKGN